MRRLVLAALVLAACSHPAKKQVPVAAPDAAPPPPDQIAVAEQLVAAMTKGDFAAVEQRFDATMKQQVPVDKLAKGWAAMEVETGKFQTVKETRKETVGDTDVVHVVCAFEQGDLDVKIAFDKDGQIGGLFFAPPEATSYTTPPYVKDASFHEEPVTVGDRDWPLPGALTVPIGAGPFPCVVMLAGSGPEDEDETIGPNKPLRDLAWGLASQGVASLRYDKRTRALGPKVVGVYKDKVTAKEEVVDDALAAISLARSRRECDPKKIFLLGHSLGGYLAPRIADEDKGRPPLAGLILLAANTRPLEDLIAEQEAYIMSISDKLSDADKSAQIDGLSKQIARVKDPKLSADTPPSDLPLGIPAAYWLDLRDYRPTDLAVKLGVPMFIARGDRDYQVADQDTSLWRAAVGAKPTTVIKTYPKLNHLFIPGEGRPDPKEYSKPGHVDAQVIDDVAAWVKR